MGDTIDIFIKYAGPPLPLALQLARSLETPGFFSGSHYAWIPVDAARWIRRQWLAAAEPRWERFARALFGRLTDLGVPLLMMDPRTCGVLAESKTPEPRGAVPFWYHAGMATNLRLRPDAEDAVRAEARRSGRSQQDVIREAVDRYLGLASRAVPGSELDELVASGAVLPPRVPYRKPRRRLSLQTGVSTAELLDRSERL